MQKLRMRYKLWIFLAVIIFLAIWCFWPLLTESRSTCPFYLMYGSREDGSYTRVMNVYNGSNGIRHVMEVKGDSYKNSYDSLIPLGFNKKRNVWVLSNAFPSDDKASGEDIILYRGKKRIGVRLVNLPDTANLEQASLLGNNVFVPFVEKGKLVVHCYYLTGKLNYKRVMSVPHAYIEAVYGRYFAIAKNGCVAADLRVSSVSDDSSIYVFDKNNRLIRVIKDAGDAQISPDGNGLAYFGGNPNEIEIMDLRSGRRRVIRTWPQPNARLWDMLSSSADFRWDSRHNWLLCAYELVITGWRPVYAADISTNKVRWKRLPMNVDTWRWVILDEVPDSLRKQR